MASKRRTWAQYDQQIKVTEMLLPHAGKQKREGFSEVKTFIVTGTGELGTVGHDP
jgi:hypothetical protein